MTVASSYALERYAAFIDRTCVEKTTFKAKGRALIFLHRRKYSGMQAYSCRFCGLWHIGHPKPVVRGTP